MENSREKYCGKKEKFWILFGGLFSDSSYFAEASMKN
jgi:hypothetical protein